MRRTTILRTAAVAALALAMGTSALGANGLSPAGSENENAGVTAATAHMDVSSVAAGVLGALVGGSNPSTTISKHAAANDHANATTNDEDADTDTEDVSHGDEVGQTGTAGTKPGFGCGDANHTHSGPPGRPGASQPPGCSKSH